MTQSNRIEVKEALLDIKNGMSDLDLMLKHRLSARGLGRFFRGLVSAGLLEPKELELRPGGSDPELELDFSNLNIGSTSPPEPAQAIPKEVSVVITNRPYLLDKIKKTLQSTTEFSIKVFESYPTTEQIYAINPIMIILDISIGESQATSFVKDMDGLREITPVVIISKRSSKNKALSVLSHGAGQVIFEDDEEILFEKSLALVAKNSELLKFKSDHKRLIEEEVHDRTLHLLQAKDFLRGILDSSTLVSVIATDMDQSILFWNKGAENIFGYTSKEMVGAKISRLYPPDDETKGTIEQLRFGARSKSGVLYARMNQITKFGEVVTMSLAITPIVGRSGEVGGILGVGLDVTEEVKQQKEIMDLLNQVRKTQDVTVFSLARLAESRDEETGLHLIRIQRYCRVLAEGLLERNPDEALLDSRFIDDLTQSCVLHDIGKVAAPDEVLMCTEKFSPEQRKVMEMHTIWGGRALEYGVKSLGENSFLSVGMEVAFYHHERWDGTGYPYGLKGLEIPLSARIVALADVYDALTTKRRYKNAYTHERAVEIIESSSGTQFDPDLVIVFLQKEREFFRIRLENSGDTSTEVCDD